MRKKIGQFFTPPSVAIYMAKLAEYKGTRLRILDTGAGTLMLIGAVCQQIIEVEGIVEVHVDLYENDPNILPILKENITFIQMCMENLAEKNWLYFIEAVTSVGPVSVKRVNEINDMLENCDSGVVFVTAFLDMSSKNGFKKYIDQIAWETEVWVADNPDHMIHMNGDRFMGPR